MESECINWMLKRMDTEVVRGEEVPNHPKNGGRRVVCTHPRLNGKSLGVLPRLR